MPTDEHRQGAAGQALHKITVTNLLSFGPEGVPLELRPLNVFIGPNGSGKSNLLEAIALLRATPVPYAPNSTGDLLDVIRKGGGITEWVWKGSPDAPASVDAVVANPKGKQPLRHVLRLRAEGQLLRLDDERIENENPYDGRHDAYFYYRFQHGDPVVNVREVERKLSRETVDASQSILSQRRDPEAYPEITYLAKTYERIRIYRDWAFGRSSVFRMPQPADTRGEVLEEDFANLGLFLNYLRSNPEAKRSVLSGLRDLYEGLDDFDVRVKGGTVQVFLTEGEFTIPGNRLSDGTMRYLCLLGVLCDPEPPPLVCIEEPELGLHPDLLPRLADLLAEASKRTQLIVTTHSDILVDAMTERPESVVVFEKHEGRTEARRLDGGQLAAWLENYRLGQLWTRGQLGGTRW